MKKLTTLLLLAAAAFSSSASFAADREQAKPEKARAIALLDNEIKEAYKVGGAYALACETYLILEEDWCAGTSYNRERGGVNEFIKLSYEKLSSYAVYFATLSKEEQEAKQDEFNALAVDLEYWRVKRENVYKRYLRYCIEHKQQARLDISEEEQDELADALDQLREDLTQAFLTATKEGKKEAAREFHRLLSNPTNLTYSVLSARYGDNLPLPKVRSYQDWGKYSKQIDKLEEEKEALSK